MRAKVKLVPAKERVTDLALRYNDIHTFHEDMRTLVYRGELDIVFGFAKQEWLQLDFCADLKPAGSVRASAVGTARNYVASVEHIAQVAVDLYGA